MEDPETDAPVSAIEVQNLTACTLSLRFSGPQARQLQIHTGGGAQLTLPQGTYHVIVHADDPAVAPCASPLDLHEEECTIGIYPGNEGKTLSLVITNRID